MDEAGSTTTTNPRARRIALWVFAAFFLLLSAWLIPGSIWGTTDNSPLGGGLVYAISVPVLVVALVLLWCAIRAQGKRRTTT